MSSPPADVTELLAAWRHRDRNALERLVPLVYSELRQLAARYMRRENAGHTLQTTALVHEAYLPLPRRTWAASHSSRAAGRRSTLRPVI